MKTKFTLVMSLILVIAIAFSTVIVVSAASDEATINGKTATVGDEVEYSFYIESDVQDLVGIQMVFIYDQNVLYVNSVECPSLTDTACNNDRKDGIIYINNSIIEGVDISSKTQIAKIKFEVKSEGSTDISYYIQYLYDCDITNLYDYQLTCSLDIDDKNVIDNGIPSLAEVWELEKRDSDFDMGDFDNTSNGKGSGVKPTYSVDDWEDFDDSDSYDDFEDIYDDSDEDDFIDRPATGFDGISTGRASFISLLSGIFVIFLLFSVFI